MLVNFLKYTLENVERSIEFEIELLSRKNRINDMIEAEIKQVNKNILYPIHAIFIIIIIIDRE